MFSRRRFVSALLSSTALAAALPAAAQAARPNIITIVLDDVGFSDLGCFGAEIRTPNIDRLAAAGLRFNRFDTKAVCSPTRAALLTGRNSHTVNMPDVPDAAAGPSAANWPPGSFHMPANVQTTAQVLKGAGYATWLVGKWHLIPMDQLDEKASKENWPLQRGFDYFYGFPRGWTDQYRPTLVENNGYIQPKLPEGYHLSADLIDRSISLIDAHRGEGAGRPFFLHLGLGVAHSPIQVPASYSDRYKGAYDGGWDVPEPLRSQMLYGDFQAGISDDPWQVIPTAWVDAAQARWKKLDKKPRMDSLGVDVARGGKDKTTIARRHEGMWFDEPLTYPGKDTPDGPTVAGLVLAASRDRAPIHLDVIGVGASPYDFLNQAGQPVIGVNVAESARGMDKSGRLKFANQRSELWWRMREALDPANNTGIALPPSRELAQELCTPKWRMQGMTIYVESRDDIVSRIGRSPDLASAYILALMDTPTLERLQMAGGVHTANARDYDPYASR
jgi:hypothetical protein